MAFHLPFVAGNAPNLYIHTPLYIFGGNIRDLKWFRTICCYLCNLRYTFHFDSELQVQIDIYFFAVSVAKKGRKV